MADLMTRLAALHDGAPGTVDDGIIAADLRRGHAAVIARRRRRTGVASAATLGIVAVGSLSYAFTTSDHPRVAQALAPRVVVTHAPSDAASTTTKPHASAAASPIELVAYDGKQLPGYTVKWIPKGYVLQGISGSVLDVSEQGDHSPLDTFLGKLVVMLNDHPGPTDGQPVTVSARPGNITDQDGVLALYFNDGTHNVEVQAWSNVRLSRAQLIQFAEGVTVLPSAQEGHG
jgi:hypothetical protein